MSVDPRSTDHATTASIRSRNCGFDAGSRTGHEPSGGRPPLADRIEHLQLRLRVAALERALAESTRRRQAIIDQYERRLEAATTPSCECSDDGVWAYVRAISTPFGR